MTADHPRVVGDVGKAGVAIDSVEDMKILFDGIPLDQMSVSMTMNGAVIPILAFFIVAGEEQGVSQAQLDGTIQNDILKEFMVRNTYIYPPEPSMRIVSDIIAYTSANMPKFNSISISGYHMHEAGATAVQELAFTIADGKEYVQRAMESGLDIDAFAGRLSFFFGIGMNFFMEVSKLRAARTLWHRVMDGLGAKDERSKMLRTHCQTSGVSLQEQDPYNNVIRTTIEAMAATLGGTQSLHTNALDEAIALPTDFQRADCAKHADRAGRRKRHHQGRRSAWRQLLCRSPDRRTGRSGVEDYRGSRCTWRHDQSGRIGHAQTPDRRSRRRAPGARGQGRGRHRRRQQIQARRPKTIWIRSTFDNDAVRQGRLRVWQRCVHRATRRNAGGVGRFDPRCSECKSSPARGGEPSAGWWRGDAPIERALPLRQALTRLPPPLRGEDLRTTFWHSPSDAARARATLGEISDAMELVFGRYATTPVPVKGIYGSAHEFDAAWALVVEGVDAVGRRLGHKPRVLIAKMGQDGHDRGANVVASAFNDMGFEAISGPLFQTPEETLALALEKGRRRHRRILTRRWP